MTVETLDEMYNTFSVIETIKQIESFFVDAIPFILLQYPLNRQLF
jgi:hypothetical protein